MAAEFGVSQTTIWRIWCEHGLKPHRIDRFKLSTDPQFVEKLRDVVGLYVARRSGRWSFRWTRRLWKDFSAGIRTKRR